MTSPNLIQKGISDETFASFIEMGFSSEMIARAIEETGGEAISYCVLSEICDSEFCKSMKCY